MVYIGLIAVEKSLSRVSLLERVDIAYVMDHHLTVETICDACACLMTIVSISKTSQQNWTFSDVFGALVAALDSIAVQKILGWASKRPFSWILDTALKTFK